MAFIELEMYCFVFHAFIIRPSVFLKNNSCDFGNASRKTLTQVSFMLRQHDGKKTPGELCQSFISPNLFLANV